jgi:polyisoprenoid-binding protein YceI
MTRHAETVGQGTRESTRRAPSPDLERWEIDPARSSLKFVLRHLVISEIRGQFRRWGGTLFFDRERPLLSSLEVWVEAATIDTDSVERDEHIRGSEFLDVKQFPRAVFESSSVEPRDGHVLVRGRLSLHGVAHDLDVEIDPFVTPPQIDQVYRVSAKLDRQSFGLHWNQDLDVGGVVVGDEITVKAELRLVRKNGEATSGEAKSGEAKSGEAKSGEAKSNFVKGSA